MNVAKIILVCVAALWFCRPVDAQTSKPAPETIRLSIQPSPLPARALRHALLPPVSELTDGPAVPLLLQGLIFANNSLDDVDTNELDELPLEKLRTDPRVRKLLGGQADPRRFTIILPWEIPNGSLHLAARRRDVDWGLPLKEQGFRTTLIHLNSMRVANDVLVIEARLALAEGRFDDAVYTMQTGLSMARMLGNQALMIQTLVEVGIADRMLSVVEQATQVRGSPNLYWALAAIPRPFADAPGALDWERTTLLSEFPALRDPVHASRDQMDYVVRHLNETFPTTRPAPPNTAAPSSNKLEQARRMLLERGAAAPDIEKMPAGELQARADAIQTIETIDVMRKVVELPVWQSFPRLAEIEAGLRTERDSNRMLQSVPTVARFAFALAKLDRKIAMLQTIEAIRAFAAAHAGQLPGSLDAMEQTPAPLDPTTGKPFEYRLVGRTATLKGPSLADQTIDQSLTYELTSSAP
jgi:hypothetical protein